MTADPDIAAVVIGRNEGPRLEACLASLQAAGLSRIIYVDSGSTDGSVAHATGVGAEVIPLDTTQAFTAARARNAGIAALQDAPPAFVQFVDGDCRLDPEWIATARAFLAEHPNVAVVCGRRREIAPEATRYNRLCDAEWDTPIGPAMACGGDALMRWAALDQVQGYNPNLIAGEEPEMCYRMRQHGWGIHRLDAEMTLHDAAMTRFSQFWKRAERAGFTYAEGAAMYGRTPERYNVAPLRRALIWGLALPVFVLISALVAGPVALLLALIYPAQFLRLTRRFGAEQAAFFILGKFAEAKGVLVYYWRRWRGANPQLIEYK